jgi:hypothetical protein
LPARRERILLLLKQLLKQCSGSSDVEGSHSRRLKPYRIEPRISTVPRRAVRRFQPKAVMFPTDAKLLNRARERLVRLAELVVAIVRLVLTLPDLGFRMFYFKLRRLNRVSTFEVQSA